MLFLTLTILGVVSTPTNIGIDGAISHYLRPILKDEAARVDYSGLCTGSGKLVLPDVTAEAAPQGITGIAAVRQVFKDDPRVNVVQEHSGILRITVGTVSNTILQTRLPALTLDAGDQYTPPAAVATIGITADMYAKTHGQAFRMAATPIDVIVQGPGKGAPHLPPLMKNVTVGEALDAVAKTFKGIVLYGACKPADGKELFRVDYIYGS